MTKMTVVAAMSGMIFAGPIAVFALSSPAGSESESAICELKTNVEREPVSAPTISPSSVDQKQVAGNSVIKNGEGVSIDSYQTVPVSGYITLNGSGFVSSPGGFVTVNLQGWTTLRDSSGRFQSLDSEITVTASLFTSGTMVSGYVYPNSSVAIYYNGQYVGQANTNGSIYVSGMVNGNWVSVNGSGYLQGTATINIPSSGNGQDSRDSD